jgi:hypothetical protein
VIAGGKSDPPATAGGNDKTRSLTRARSLHFARGQGAQKKGAGDDEQRAAFDPHALFGLKEFDNHRGYDAEQTQAPRQLKHNAQDLRHPSTS